MRTRLGLLLFTAALLFCLPTLVHGQGIIFPWTGPVQRSMGGAGTGLHVDAISTTYWNPAAMADAEASELSVAVDMIFPFMQTSSSITGLAAGTTEADAGVIPLPQIGWIQKSCNPCVNYGLSISAVGGAKTNYPSSTTNPLFLPQSNTPGFPGGIGRADTSLQFLQIMPSLSYVINDRLSVGIGPTLTLGQLLADPFILAAPDDADGSGQPRYPMGSGAKMAWGGGFQVSTFYKPDPCYSFGATFRSPQWMGSFDNLSEDENGFPRVVSAKFDVPMIVSVGMAYHGLPDSIVAFDMRYVGNQAADGFGDEGFNPDGSLAGLGYSDQFLFATGIRHRLSELFTFGAGYTFNTNPLSDSEATIGTLAPLYYQHVFSTGGTFHLNDNANLNLAYSFSPTNDLSGPILTPFGPVPNSNVTTEVFVHAASLGVSVRY